MSTQAQTLNPHTGEAIQKFFIFDTHPIQYRTPVFAALHRKLPSLKVFFFNEYFDGKKWWFHEVGKIPDQKWELRLREGFPNEVIGSYRLGWWRFYHRMKSFLLSERPMAVAIYGYYMPEHWVLWWLCKRLEIPLLFVGETFSQGSSIGRKLIKGVLQPLFFGSIYQFIAIGEKTVEFYRSLKVETARITRARYCVDTHFFELSFETSQETRQRVRRQWNIPEDAFVLLFVGRLFERKRPWDMIALHHHLSTFARIYTVIIGNGPLEAELREDAFENPRLILAGFRNQGETRDFYHAADLLVVPSEFETWGLVVNEAFACKLPAVVTEQCGVAGDLVIPGETGLVYEPGNIEAAGYLIQQLMEDRAKLKRLGENAHQKVTREYHVEQFAEAFVKALSGLVT